VNKNLYVSLLISNQSLFSASLTDPAPACMHIRVLVLPVHICKFLWPTSIWIRDDSKTYYSTNYIFIPWQEYMYIIIVLAQFILIEKRKMTCALSDRIDYQNECTPVLLCACLENKKIECASLSIFLVCLKLSPRPLKCQYTRVTN